MDKMQALRRQGYRVIILSNTNPFMMDWAEKGNFDSLGHTLDDYADADCLGQYTVRSTDSGTPPSSRYRARTVMAVRSTVVPSSRLMKT